MRLQSIGETFFIPRNVQQCLWSICAYASALLFVEGLVKSIQFWLTYTSLIKELGISVDVFFLSLVGFPVPRNVAMKVVL